MELRELISKTHDLNEQLRQLQAQEIGIKEQLAVLETQIKSKLDETGTDYENLTEAEFQLLMAELGDPMMLSVEVVYATKAQQIIKAVQLARGTTIEDAIVLSGILDKCPEIDLGSNKVGIHGMIKPLTDMLTDGDRVEIYRPVTAKA